MNLTDKEQRVYAFIERYIENEGYSPTFREIQEEFGFKSVNSVQKYVSQLQAKGMLRISQKGHKRSIALAETGEGTLVLPLLGIVAAGQPIEAIERQDTVEVPREMVGSGDYFGLKIQGFSMVEDGLLDGDILVVKRQATASNGQTVVALVDGEATVKKYFRHENSVELRPANPSMAPLFIRGGEFQIQGVFAGLLRKGS